MSAAYEEETYPEPRLEALLRAQLDSFRPKARALVQRLGVAARVRGLAVERATLETWARREPASRWDAICIWNTFDQLPDPGGVLTAARRLLDGPRELYVRVPNGGCYRAWARGERGAPSFTALAWNNLATFPYLQGYSAASLDGLLERHGFRRAALRGDTLCRLADTDSTLRARLEEAAWKSAERALGRWDPEAAPWIEVRCVASAASEPAPARRERAPARDGLSPWSNRSASASSDSAAPAASA